MKQKFLVFYILDFLAMSHCWQFFTGFNDLVLTNSYPEEKIVHSEYKFGKCNDKSIIFYLHQRLDAVDILGKITIRSWIDVIRIPTCIILRAEAYSDDFMRSTSYTFQICVPRITYCHTHRRYKYYYYEWYIPHDYVGGMNWDLYFFGPSKPDW